MIRWVLLLLTAAGGGLPAASDPPTPQAGGDVVFRTDVALVRVDAQVLDRNNQALAGLKEEDFVLREEGRPQQIRGFNRENMPVDVLLLLDVSASMRPHVQRIAGASHQALQVLGDNGRMGIMLFDRSSRLRLPFRADPAAVERELESILKHEGFRGGTDIARGLLDAAAYVEREGRRDARRAIIIVTDDQTEIARARDGAAVSRALTKAEAVLMALLAPDALRTGRSRSPGGGYPGGGTWPGGTGRRGPWGGPPVVLGPGGPRGGGQRGGGPAGSRTESAGTAEIARESGGDSMPVSEASALADALARIRQRYSLFFYLPADVKPGQERNIEVDLSAQARRHHPDAEVRFRRVYLAPGGGRDSPGPTMVTRAPSPQSPPQHDGERLRWKRRPAVNEEDARSSGPLVKAEAAGSNTAQPPPSNPSPPQQPRGGWRRVDEPAPTSTPGTTPNEKTPPEPPPAGWRRANPGQFW